MKTEDVKPWPHGKCEAGVPGMSASASNLPYCNRRGRWLVQGTILCGTCAKKLRVL